MTRSNRLSEIQHRDVMTVYKMLFKNNILGNEVTSNLNEIKLYAPNKSMIMCELTSLFYVDIASYEHFIDEHDRLKEICLFDIEDLSRLFEDPNYYDKKSASKKVNDTNILNKIMMNRLNWLKLFDSPFFKTCKNLAPNPISKIITMKIKNEKSVLNNSKEDTDLNTKLHSNEFAKALIDVIQALDESKKNTINSQVFDLIKNVLSNIKCLISKDIKIHLLDVKTNKIIENSERDLNFYPSTDPSSNQTIILRSTKCDDDIDKFQILSETILILIQVSFSVEKDFQMLNDILKSQNHRFILLTNKLLKSNDYSEIIRNYKLNYINNIKS